MRREHWHLFLVAAWMATLSGCSSAKLKRCDARPDDPRIFVCKERAQGIYLWCEPPKNLYLCEDPQ